MEIEERTAIRNTYLRCPAMVQPQDVPQVQVSKISNL